MNRHATLADAYGRYAALIAAQLEALENGDETAFEDLSRERTTLAGAIDALQTNEQHAPRQLEELRRLVQSCVAADKRLRARLESLRAEHLNEARRLDANRAAVRSYTSPEVAGRHLDFRL